MLLARRYGRVVSLNVTWMLPPPFPHPVTGEVDEPKTGDGSRASQQAILAVHARSEESWGATHAQACGAVGTGFYLCGPGH